MAKTFWCFSLIQLLRIRWNMVEILLVRFSFLTDRKSNIATAAWDSLRHFEILLQVDNRISQKIAEKFVVRCWSCCYFLDRWKSKCGHQILYHMRHFEFLQIVLISWNMAEISLIRCWPGVVTFNLNGNPIWSLVLWIYSVQVYFLRWNLWDMGLLFNRCLYCPLYLCILNYFYNIS